MLPSPAYVFQRESPQPATPLTETFNIASYLLRAADRAAQRVAVVSARRVKGGTGISSARDCEFRGQLLPVPVENRCHTADSSSVESWGRTSITFGELEVKSNRYANGLVDVGITRGMRTLVMVRPGVDFIAVMFALFKIGAVPVLIDPGMGLSRLLECIRSVSAEALIGIPLAQAVRVLKPRAFRSVKHVVTVGRRWFWGGPTLAELERVALTPAPLSPALTPTLSQGERGSNALTPALSRGERGNDDEKTTAQEQWHTGIRDSGCVGSQGRGPSDRFEIATTRSDETAAILFTSGSTGPAKGVVYTHGMFDAQVRAIQSHYGIQEGEVDLTGFPPFALFSVAMGMTSVIPDMDPSRPARVNPAKIVDAIQRHQVTNTFGSPAMWRRVAAYCVERQIKLGSLRRVLIAGAPVEQRLIEQVRSILSAGADVHTPYGATEAMPVTSICGAEREKTETPKRRNAETGVGRAWPANPKPSAGGTGSNAPGLAVGGTGSLLPVDRFLTPDPLHQGQAGAAPMTVAGPMGGICVGVSLPGMDVRVIRIVEEAIPEWSDEWLLPESEVGEIVVTGPVVTHEYADRPEATRSAKIREGACVWHRMGDVGFLDDGGRLWFCGRKAHRVVTDYGTLFSIPCEQVFNEHPDVFRSALIGIGPRGRQVPAMVIEPRPGRFPKGRRAALFREELLALGRGDERTSRIEHVLFHGAFPVDVRHNTKINREALALWAASRIA